MQTYDANDNTVDQVIGSAYQVVKYVAANMELLIEMSGAIGVFEGYMEDIRAVLDALPVITNVNDNMPALVNIDTHMSQLLVIHTNMASLLTIVTNINALLNVAANMSALQNIDANMDELLQIMPITEQAFEALRRSYAESGHDLIGRFSNTGLVVNTATQVVLWEPTGIAYAYSGTLPHTIGAGETPIGNPLWVAKAGGLLRSQLLGKRVYAVDFTSDNQPPNPSVINTLPIQLAIDYVYAAGGGVVDLGPWDWMVDASSLNETYDNFGAPVAANQCSIVLRKGVSLVGQKGKTKISCSDPTLIIVALVANDGNLLHGFELAGGWVQGGPGAASGIFQLGTAGGADISCKNTVLSDLYIHNVASYGIGLQNGNPENVHLARIRTDVTGADGLDLKARGSSSIPPTGNSVTDIWASRFNLRLDGSAGVDMRGIWHAKGITASDFGGDPAKTYVGVRFRTKPPVTDPYTKAAAKSTLVGFTVTPTIGSPALRTIGVECGSDDVHISDGTVEDCTFGTSHTGNAVGSATRCSVTGVTAINSRQYGFRNSIGSDDIKYIGCIDTGAATAGYRIEGTNSSAIGCTGTLSIASGSVATFIQSGGRHGASYVSTERQNDTTVAVSAKGTAADITIRVNAKGTGHCSMVGDIRPEAANTRYLGSGSLPFAGGFIQTAFTVTSDERLKVNIASILNSEAEETKAEFQSMILAWREVDFFMYQLIDRVEAKKREGKEARWHLGILAQRAIEAFTRHGLDWTMYAIFNYDKWDAEPAVYDDEGHLIVDAVDAGDKYTINYEEALILESVVRREDQSLQEAFNNAVLDRISALEAK